MPPRNVPARKDHVSSIALFVSTALGVAGLIVSLYATNRSNMVDAKVRTTRLETGTVISNTNGPQCAERWSPWQLRVSASTGFVGVKRRIAFRAPFESIPQITAALKLVNLRDADLVLRDIGFTQMPARALDRLRQLHVMVQTADHDPTGFTLEVGIGLPGAAAETLAAHLLQDRPIPSTIQDAIGFGPGSCAEKSEDNWMLMFYERIGTIEATWLVQGIEAK